MMIKPGLKALWRPLGLYQQVGTSGGAGDNVQLTPVVQPVALVPYFTQKQPLFMTEEPVQQAAI